MTWKMKNLVINKSSRPDLLGIPSNLASRRSTIGRSIIKTARRTGGKIPEMIIRESHISEISVKYEYSPYCYIFRDTV
jgi:hypothetical protein